VRQRTADRPLRQCIIALAAAYAVALSGLVASYGLAHAATATAAAPSGIICHTIVDADQAPSPASDPTDHCAANCCVGCIMLLVALPPPPATPVGALQSVGQRLSPPAHVTLAARPETASYRSRAPPSAA
jgi:hypothetical protein